MENNSLTRLAGYLLVISLSTALGWPATAWGQAGTLEGEVVDAQDGTPLAGVSVSVEGEMMGAATDPSGEYVIDGVPAGEHVVEASFVGYSPQQESIVVQPDETVTLNFELVRDELGLDEIVVTGTGGEVEQRRLGNEISTISTADLENNPIGNVSELLQGREPGVQGLPGSGLTGQGSQIRIRGSSSLSQNNEPVVYVDGIRADNAGGFSGFVATGGSGTPSRLDDLNPEAIERVEILKGASAATLFGSEASNGVIQIFTKRGDAGQDTQYSFNVEQSIISPNTRRFEPQVGFPRTQSQADQMSQYFKGDEEVERFEMVSQTAMKDLMQTGRNQTYSGTISGGTETITYFAAGRFTTEDGVMGEPPGTSVRATDELTRGMGNLNIGIFPTESTRIRLTAQYSEQDFETPQNSNSIFAPLANASGGKPEFVTENNRYGALFATIQESMQQQIQQETQRFSGNVNVNHRPLDPLTLDATFGVDFTSTLDREITPFGWNVDGLVGSNTEGQRDIAETRNVEYTLDLKANLDNEFDVDYGFINQLTSTLTIGTQSFFSQRNITSVSGTDFPGPGFDVVSAADRFSQLEQFQEIRQIGVFAQEQVGINDHIFVTGGVRLDANSAFGGDFRTVTYPKVALSYIPSDAGYWPDSSVGPLSSLRLRASWGQSGLQPGAFDAITTFDSFASADGAGITPDNLGNPDLDPEISTEYEVGLEAGFVGDRYTVDATYWDRTVDDALVARQFPPTGGFVSSQLVNIGEIKGRGVELGIDATPVRTEDFSLSLFGNASYLWEQVRDLGLAPPIKAGGAYPRVRNHVVEGFAPGAKFGAELIDTPEGFLPVDFTGDGEPDSIEELIALLDGPDPVRSTLPANTQQVLLKQSGIDELPEPLNNYQGKPWPDWQGSFGLDVGFSNFSLSTMFEYKAGNYHVNALEQAFRARNPAIGRNTEEAATVIRDFLTGGLDENNNPQHDGEVRAEALQTWVDDLLGLDPFPGMNHTQPADFIRWRELSLTYTVPQQFVSRFGAENMSVTVSGRNLRMWFTAGYDGRDPETNELGRGAGSTFDENFRQGVEAWNVPIPRRFSFSIRTTF